MRTNGRAGKGTWNSSRGVVPTTPPRPRLPAEITEVMNGCCPSRTINGTSEVENAEAKGLRVREQNPGSRPFSLESPLACAQREETSVDLLKPDDDFERRFLHNAPDLHDTERDWREFYSKGNYRDTMHEFKTFRCRAFV